MNINFIWRVAYYIQQCSKDDPEVNTCLMHSANRLARLLQAGVPELDMQEVSQICPFFRYVHT